MRVACVCTLQVRAASPDTLDTVGQLTPVFLQEINQTMNMAATTGEQREKQAELQGQLCGVLQVCDTNARETPVWLATPMLVRRLCGLRCGVTVVCECGR